MNLFNFSKKKIQGYVYTSKDENELFGNAKVGDSIIKKDKKPPFIVVDHSLDTKIITQWPGKLFKVEIINPAKEKIINKGLVKDVWYTRTYGVKILEEVEIKELFGDNGQKVEQIIDLTRNITEEKVIELSKFDKGLNKELFTKAWRNWIIIYDVNHPFINDDHHNTIKLSPKNERYSSPIKEGLSIISSQFDIRARELVGDSAFEVDEEGEIHLSPVWASAVEKILHAGMSYASDNILSESERETLRAPFIEVLGLN